jgi:hypothetical protein
MGTLSCPQGVPTLVLAGAISHLSCSGLQGAAAGLAISLSASSSIAANREMASSSSAGTAC